MPLVWRASFSRTPSLLDSTGASARPPRAASDGLESNIIDVLVATFFEATERNGMDFQAN